MRRRWSFGDRRAAAFHGRQRKRHIAAPHRRRSRGSTPRRQALGLPMPNASVTLLGYGAGAVCCLIGSAQCRRRSAELFPIGYRLQPDARSGTSILDLSELTRAGKHRPERTSQARAHSGDFPALSRSHRDRARSATRSRPTDSLISVHSFTPFQGGALWHVGVLYNRDPRSPRS
jgi:hypothetical protein